MDYIMTKSTLEQMDCIRSNGINLSKWITLKQMDYIRTNGLCFNNYFIKIIDNFTFHYHKQNPKSTNQGQKFTKQYHKFTKTRSKVNKTRPRVHKPSGIHTDHCTRISILFPDAHPHWAGSPIPSLNVHLA